MCLNPTGLFIRDICGSRGAYVPSARRCHTVPFWTRAVIQFETVPLGFWTAIAFRAALLDKGASNEPSFCVPPCVYRRAEH
jgi:hypothetical protein